MLPGVPALFVLAGQRLTRSPRIPADAALLRANVRSIPAHFPDIACIAGRMSRACWAELLVLRSP